MGVRTFIFRAWGLFQFIFVFAFLKLNGYSKIELFKFLSWHHRVSYITAINRSGEKVFIKTSGNYFAAEREYLALSLLNVNAKSKLFPFVHSFSNLYIVSFVVMEFIQGNEILADLLSKNTFYEFCINVSYELTRANIIHRDIRPGNIIVDKNNNPILIDFGWAVIDGDNYLDNRHKSCLAFLGETFKPSDYHWNDAYSLSKVYSVLFSEDIVIEHSTDYFF